MQNDVQPKRYSFKKLLKYLLISLLMVSLFEFGKILVVDRCSLISCEPASWEKIQETAIKNVNSWGVNYKLVSVPIHINYLNEGGLKKTDLMERAEVSVQYVSVNKATNIYGDTNYPKRIIEFDDNNLWVKSRNLSFASFSSLPSEEILERFKRVTIGYRDVYNLTWDKADEALDYPIEYVPILLSLDDEMQKDFNVESVWFIIYLDTKGNSVSYWLDAQTGKILKIQ